MAHYSGSKATLFIGDEALEVGAWHLDIGAEPVATAGEWKAFQEKLSGQTFTCAFAPSPEFMGVIVGMQLQYGLRELHRTLGRYLKWPYTN